VTTSAPRGRVAAAESGVSYAPGVGRGQKSGIARGELAIAVGEPGRDLAVDDRADKVPPAWASVAIRPGAGVRTTRVKREQSLFALMVGHHPLQPTGGLEAAAGAK
jgi:hypothetical protein